MKKRQNELKDDNSTVTGNPPHNCQSSDADSGFSSHPVEKDETNGHKTKRSFIVMYILQILWENKIVHQYMKYKL